MDNLYLTLLDISSSLVDEWRRALAQHVPESIRDRITIVQSTLEDLTPPESQFDCIVSPANSYGRLDGGFDYFLSQALDPDDELAPTRLVQSTLYRRWKGYAPPGSCTLVPLEGSTCENNPHGCRFIAICPTMRIPGVVTWNREIVYNCVWSLLVALTEHNDAAEPTGRVKISKILMTGLGTGTGGVSAERCAQQMALAFRDFEDAASHPEKWSAMAWADAATYADDCRSTHRL
ncbi:macro domain-like protein [Amylocystis lapponica]|nr:macro domain-like protein [Amylocystis lapponica]